MMNTTIVGRMYNGKLYDWKNKNRDDEEREMFRGRLNYKDPQGSDYYFIDAVCFNDFGSGGGLVGFLGENFSQEEGENKGRPITVTGYMRPVKKQMTVPIKINSSKGVVEKNIPNIPYETFEFVIVSASYCPTDTRTSSRRASSDAEIDMDDLDFDDVSVISANSIDDEDDDAEETKASTKRTASSKQTKPSSASSRNKKPRTTSSSSAKTTTSKTSKTKTKKNNVVTDDEFFDED